MFYTTDTNDHGLPHNPFKAIVSPRPIGWISTLDANGRTNLAPYSFFNAVNDKPPMVVFSSSGYKDSVANIDATGEFVCNMASFDLKDQMNTSSAMVPHEVSEFELAGLETAASELVKPPRIAGTASALECRHLQTQRLTDLGGQETDNYLVLGQVVGIYMDERFIVDGRFDVTRAQPLARLGYMDYSVTTDVFEMHRP